ncbi:hypothetical protein [Geothrix edaphica]|uniref:WD40 repeat domain-containing protein n=1 Tax=Geothrix edaphica TaxID=2927976 RepID=A0ABQ5Q0A6_9BACT|nr:hypothetical protein [Geothrix edaphica]GLH67815.1 hypothetical protein GETHED_21790 [Geothrix edaphica]
MRNRHSFRCLLFGLSCLAWGSPNLAAAPPMALPAGIRMVELAGTDAAGPVAIDRGGTRVAYLGRGLRIRDLAGVEQAVSTELPTQLAWSADGATLAAAFEAEGKARLRLFDAKGRPGAEVDLPGRVTGLQARNDGTWLVLTVELEPFRFGTRMAQVLHQWDGRGRPKAQVLNGSTLMPKVAESLKDQLPRILGLALSPLQDEILYYRLYNPPALASQLRLVLHHLDTGQTRVLAEVAMEAGGACFSGRGDCILYGDGVMASQLADPWGDETLATLPVPGRRVAMSPSGRTLLLDGQLFRDGRLLVSFPAETRGFFTGKGEALLLAEGGRLHWVSGLPEDAAPPLGAADAARLRELRKWLSEGLVSAEDYRTRRPAP